MSAVAPVTLAWVDRMLANQIDAVESPPELSASLKPLLAECCRTFIPLMHQNEAAYKHFWHEGQLEFNETDVVKRQALYDLEIDGYKCRSVVKTFQVKVWRAIKKRWLEL